MTVTGYLALYTTLLGWQQYNNLWEIAVGTGLIYLPFISIILRSTVEPFSSLSSKEAGSVALRRMGLNIITTFLVIAFAAAPAIPLEPQVLHYAPPCQPEKGDATPGKTGTTYDRTFPVPTGVKVPIFWYIIMSFANGVTHAAETGLSCTGLDLRTLQTQLNLTHITDAKLKQETSQFYTDCYAPAYSTYIGGRLSPQQQMQIESSLKQHGKEDVSWIGSHTFLNISGFYDAHKATQPIEDFTFNSQRDIEEGQLPNRPTWGNPDCKTWWSDSSHGLALKLKKALPPTFWQKITAFHGDQEKLQDTVVRTLITQNLHQSISDQVRGYESLNNNASGDYISRFIGGQLGIVYESLSFYPKLHLLLNALPVIQGALLFALYTFLALAIPFSSYRISFCVTGSVVLFSLIFCSFIWHLVQWFDVRLVQALYPSLGEVSGAGILNTHLPLANKMFVEMIIGTLYIVLPILWMMIMSWAGLQAGAAAASLMGAGSAPAATTGEHASHAIRKRVS